jgi:hypothetical protein
VIGSGACWAREVWAPEERIHEEVLNVIRDGGSWCAHTYQDGEGNELVKFTCREDRPVIYRVEESDLQSCTHVLRFPD